ncbi:MAG: potassium channel family protein [Gammaproteobacteria bacterium]|nr:potassium channel family protein [Gammaproteobacteria bacterium]MDH4316351.1 potassium channel family protein [Gammaproteobacteria bacterium]MDH5215480.1 potassium channel family protein [Gammaproteobacteria bacterium]MDH5500353.1 potassium channel family protein [Gammaproteobacteria bacterium]
MKQNNFAWLLVALLLLLVALPVLETLFGWRGPIMRAVPYSLVLITGVWSLRMTRKWFHTVVALAVVGVALEVLNVANQNIAFTYLALSSFLLFLLLCTFLVLRQVLTGTEVDLNRIAGAFCAYLMLGFIWSIAYMTLFAMDPGSFHGLPQTADDLRLLDLQYFSFVTMTTLGYGDVSPVSDAARALAAVEAVIGQFYLAVLVAALVGAYVANTHGGRQRGD